MSEATDYIEKARAYLADRSGKWEAPPSAPVGSDGQPMFNVIASLMATVDESSGDVQLSPVTPVPERKMADIQGDMRQLIRDLGPARFGEIADRAVDLIGDAYDIGYAEGFEAGL